MKKSKSYLHLSMSFLSLVIASTAFSGGFEKAVLWSGHYAGLAGAGANATGAEALYFNPAGLAGSKAIEFTINGSPTTLGFSAPLTASATPTNSDSALVTPISVFVNYPVTSQLGLGLGFYPAGGGKVTFTGVDYSSIAANYVNFKPNLKSEIQANELSLGAGYELLDGLRVGAAYRMVFVSANFSLASVSTASLLAVDLNGLSATQGGFRLGVEYAPKGADWGLGLQWRSEIAFTGTGTSTGKVITASAATTPAALGVTGGAVTAANSLPQQISLGGFYDISPDKLRVLAQYDFTEYFKDQALVIAGNLTLPAALGSTVKAISNYPQNWSNMQNLKLAVEFKVSDWDLRAGYVYTSAVTPKSSPSPVFSSPGSANTFVLGAGKSLTSSLGANVALEYSAESGTVASTDVASPIAPPAIPGVYSANSFAAHLGLTYSM
jgi:long-chain fatty acid transport protein